MIATTIHNDQNPYHGCISDGHEYGSHDDDDDDTRSNDSDRGDLGYHDLHIHRESCSQT